MAVLARPDKRDFGLVAGAGIMWFLAYRQLHPVADWLTYDVLALDKESHLGESLNFLSMMCPKFCSSSVA